jgi:hypothetical protein
VVSSILIMAVGGGVDASLLGLTESRPDEYPPSEAEEAEMMPQAVKEETGAADGVVEEQEVDEERGTVTVSGAASLAWRISFDLIPR